MRQALLGVSIFIGLQLVYAIVLFVVTIWELRHLDRPIPVSPRAPGPITEPPEEPLDRAA